MSAEPLEYPIKLRYENGIDVIISWSESMLMDGHWTSLCMRRENQRI